MRNIYKIAAAALLILAPVAASAQAVDTAALQAQVAALLAQVSSLTNGQGTAPASTGVQNGSAACVNLSRTLARGDSGDDVKALQQALIAANLLDQENASGFFGALTEAALKQWQSAHGIEPLGITGPKTRSAIACGAGSSLVPTGPVSTQCPTVPKPAQCTTPVAVQLSGCTVGWQCSVASLPEQTFSAAPVSGQAPLRVKFTGVVTSANEGFCEGNFCAATLVFGDGTTGAVPLPNTQNALVSYQIFHTYPAAGSFIASLYQGAAGSGAGTVGTSQTVTVSAPPAPPAPTTPALIVAPNSGAAPLAVSFTASNVSASQNLSIDFGDGTYGSVLQQGSALGVQHTYASAGSYTAKLRTGAGQVLATAAVTVTGGSASTPQLVATPSNGYAPLNVTFSMNGGNTTYTGSVVLDFGDGSSDVVCPAGSLCGQRTVQHSFAAAGTYSVQLLSLGQNAGVVLARATVTATTILPASFTATTTTGTVPFNATFTGTGGNQIYPGGVIVDYGDGATEQFCTATEQCGQKVKTHTYADGNQYAAQLISFDASNASSTLGSVVITATGGPLKIKVTAPTGSVRKGDTTPISWTITGTKPTSGSISFDLYSKAGTRIGSIFSITQFQSGSANWKIPSTLDRNCSTTQPNGLCGVNLTPGEYSIVANVTGVTPAPQILGSANFRVLDGTIAQGAFTLSFNPSTVEAGKQVVIKYSVANPPYNGGVAMSLVNASGTLVSQAATRQQPDSEATTYIYTIPASVAPGQYYITGVVYSPIDKDSNSSDATIFATATSSPLTIKAPGTGAGCVVLNNNLTQGDTDDTTDGDVSRLQQFLAQDTAIYPEGIINGTYGPATRRAVERFQAANGIASSGTPDTNGFGAVGPRTRAAISAVCNGSTGSKLIATPAVGRVPLAVTFKVKDVSDPYSVDFGDGVIVQVAANSAGQMAHTYSQTGTYIAKLIVAGQSVGTASVKVTNDVTTPPQSCAAITHTLQSDDTDAATGGDVSRLQQFLAQDPSIYPEGKVTGYYGPATIAAVKRYQQGKGISQTGSIGPVTLESISCKVAGSSVFSGTPLAGLAPLAVKFSTNRNVTTGSYRIDFGDGASQWLSTTTSSHTYSNNGTYTASLVQSVGNCFGLTGDALAICEIGANSTIATLSVNVGTTTPATGAINNAHDFYKFMYSCVLDRAGSETEIASWISVHASLDGAYNGFFNSTEFISKNLSNTDFVNKLYQCVLLRAPESSGVTYWVNQLNNGMTRTNLLLSGFLNGTEFNSLDRAKLTTALNTAAPAASISVSITPSATQQGRTLSINWTSTNAPVGSIVRLEAYPDGSTEPDAASNNEAGLTSNSSQLAASGSFTWGIPTGDAIIVDGGFRSSIAPGVWHVVAKLYTGNTCWGYCLQGPGRTVAATARSSNFTVSPAEHLVPVNDPAPGATPGTSISCVGQSSRPARLTITFSDFTTRTFDLNTAGASQTFSDSHRAEPFGANFYSQVGFGDTGQDAWSTMQTIQSVSGNTMSLQGNSTVAGGSASYTCTVTWN